jgi:dihydrofolate reductase
LQVAQHFFPTSQFSKRLELEAIFSQDCETSSFNISYSRPYSLPHSVHGVRKLILNLAVSLDGFIEGPNGEFDWCFTDQDYGMKDFLRRIDAVFFGRKSYEVLLGMEKKPFPKMKKYVFSKTLESMEDVSIIRDAIGDTVRTIKKQAGKDIWLFGGASLISSLMTLGLVDELQLAVHPILLGTGKHLLSDIQNRIPLKLVDTKTYSSGLVQLFYQVAKPKKPRNADRRKA